MAIQGTPQFKWSTLLPLRRHTALLLLPASSTDTSDQFAKPPPTTRGERTSRSPFLHSVKSTGEQLIPVGLARLSWWGGTRWLRARIQNLKRVRQWSLHTVKHGRGRQYHPDDIALLRSDIHRDNAHLRMGIRLGFEFPAV